MVTLSLILKVFVLRTQQQKALLPLQAYDFTFLPISPTGRDGNQEPVVLHNCSSVPWNPFQLLGIGFALQSAEFSQI